MGSEPHPASYVKGTEISFSGSKASGARSYHSPLSSAEFKIVSSFISAPQFTAYALIKHKVNFTFYFNTI
jgi:hypothetical protein